jgi:hypothetical protein
MFEPNVFLVDPVRCSRFEFSPQMPFAVKIRQHKAFGFVADRQWNVRKTLFAGGRTRRRRFPATLSFATL